MSTYYPFMCKYINILNNYKNGNLILNDDKVFEYVAAIHLKMVMWDDVRNIKEARLSIQYFEKDSGIDIISYNLSVAGQVKYINHLTWEDLNTYRGYCNHLRNIDKLVLVIRHDTTISSRVRDLCKIIRLNIVEEMDNLPLTAPKLIINKQLKYSSLSTDEKINEILAYGKKPKSGVKFSSGKSMYKFWNYIIYSRMLNSAAYTKLRESSFVMEHYLKRRDEDENDFQYQINSLLTYLQDHIAITKINTFDYKLYDNFIIWHECKTYRKCETYPWSQLLDFNLLKQDYYRHLKVVDPDVYHIAKRVDELVEFIKRGIPIFDDDIWTRCVNDDKLCSVWPYNNLFKYTDIKIAHFSTTVNFPYSDYEYIYNTLEHDEEMNKMFDFSNISSD